MHRTPPFLAPRATGRIMSVVLSLVLVTAQAAAQSAAQKTIPELRREIAQLDVTVDDETRSDAVRDQARALRAVRQRQLLDAEVADLQRFAKESEGLVTPEEAQRLAEQIASLSARLRGSTERRDVTIPPADPPRRVASSPQAKDAPDPPAGDCWTDAPPALKKIVHDVATDVVHQLLTRQRQPVFGDYFDQIAAEAIAARLGHDSVAQAQKAANDAVDQDLAAAVELSRTDKQVGSPDGTDGTTTLAEKPAFARLLGLAIENGAVDQQIDGTTLTLSTTPYALVAMNENDTARTYARYEALTRVGASATFQLEDANDPLASARRSQLDTWSVRLRLTGDVSSRSHRAEVAFRTRIMNKLTYGGSVTRLISEEFKGPLDEKRRTFIGRVQSDLAFDLKDATTDKEDSVIAQVESRLLCDYAEFLDGLLADAKSDTAFSSEAIRRMRNDTIPGYIHAKLQTDEAIEEFETILDELEARPEVTVAYENKRVPDGSDYSTVKLLYQQGLATTLKIVANGGVSFYHDPDETKLQRDVRDVAANLSLEGTIGRHNFLVRGDKPDFSPVTYSFTGRYQRLFENARIPGMKADIATAQFKMEFPIGQGCSIPVSVSWANATSLINEDHVTGHIGFTFDVDKLLKFGKLFRK